MWIIYSSHSEVSVDITWHVLFVKQEVISYYIECQTRTPVRNWVIWRVSCGSPGCGIIITRFCLLGFFQILQDHTANSMLFIVPAKQMKNNVGFTCLWSSPAMREISGGLGTMYAVSWVTIWTCLGSSHGVTPAWWTNIRAYKVPLLRVFFGRETFTNLEGKKKTKFYQK